MRAYAYNFQQLSNRTIDDLTALIFERSLDNRSFGGEASLRLEDRRVDGDFLLLDFAKERGGHGPGRYSRRAPLANFNLGAGESFGEDTALICHLPSRTAAIQYNHSGPKIGRIEDYLYAADLEFGLGPAIEGVNDEDRCGYRFGAVLTPDAIARMRQFGIYRKIDFAIALPGIQQNDANRGRGLADAIRQPLPGGVETITMSIGATTTNESELAPEGVHGFITDLLSLGPALTRAVVKGKADEDAQVEDVDLVRDRVKADCSLEFGPGRRYLTNDRWTALLQSWRGWHNAGLLPV